ncbi:IclR family transcriptional regulator [Roseiarcaceae bacterium H3SJ34-1]|uniref:IclR family transcriptional regulator n=1 Tax=Terripilifer ovatus TaxID=3032367 RepID=UPI003AB995C3|nr:IclR family transcriptional regulator [Roseiarcaceae bacterium H3SJ34-1]
MAKDASPAGVRVIDRAIDILECFDETHEKATLQELADRTGIHKATALRLLATLVEAGILDQPVASGAYELGFFALKCADTILAASDLRKRAAPVMRQLRDELNETIVLSTRNGNLILNLDKFLSRHGIIEAPTIGVYTALHETSAGLAVLSTFSRGQLEAYMEECCSHMTASDTRALRESIAKINAPAKSPPRNRTLAVPIVDGDGRAHAALSIQIPSGRIEPDLVERCLKGLRSAARKLNA